MKQYNHIYTTTDSLYEYLQTHSIDMYAENILTDVTIIQNPKLTIGMELLGKL